MACQYDKKFTKKTLIKPLKRTRCHLTIYRDILSNLPPGPDEEIPVEELAKKIILSAKRKDQEHQPDERNLIEKLQGIKEGFRHTLELHLGAFDYETNPKSTHAVTARAIALAFCALEDAMPSVEKVVINSVR